LSQGILSGGHAFCLVSGFGSSAGRARGDHRGRDSGTGCGSACSAWGSCCAAPSPVRSSRPRAYKYLIFAQKEKRPIILKTDPFQGVRWFAMLTRHQQPRMRHREPPNSVSKRIKREPAAYRPLLCVCLAAAAIETNSAFAAPRPSALWALPARPLTRTSARFRAPIMRDRRASGDLKRFKKGSGEQRSRWDGRGVSGRCGGYAEVSEEIRVRSVRWVYFAACECLSSGRYDLTVCGRSYNNATARSVHLGCERRPTADTVRCPARRPPRAAPLVSRALRAVPRPSRERSGRQ
jgi:hypothetical protein